MTTALRGTCATMAFAEASGELRPLSEFMLEKAAAIHAALPLPVVLRSRSSGFGPRSSRLQTDYGSQGFIQSP
jgi:hypothetical protein